MYKYFKRLLDIIISFTALIFLLPVMILIAAAVKIDSPGAVFFLQNRIGRNKKKFRIYKFRTMRSEAPADTPTHLFNNPDVYITKVGRLLRKTSLDELPQLFNIFKGEMSFVGPRPALWNQFDLIQKRDAYGANQIRPGLTGLAQINGRDELSIDEKVRFDGEYAKDISFWLDVKIFCLTILKVLRADDISN